jgi:hydroxymethylbilane synthase
MTAKLRVGTRGSTLALKQVDLVQAALAGVELERIIVRTEGDRRIDVTLDQLGGQGVFVKDIEARLLTGEIDIAVHSLKDMPAETPVGLVIGAVLSRADARDVLVSRSNLKLQQLPSGARIGTDSRRRAVQLRAIRPDIRVESVRGNVDTRMRKVAEGVLDAVVLAAAGLDRLGMLEHASQVFSADEMLPAVGQGVLAVESRADDAETIALLQAAEDTETRVAITAERAYLRRLGAGCRLPVAAYGTLEDGRLRLRGLLATDSGELVRDEAIGEPADADALGRSLAEKLAQRAGIPAGSLS